MVKSIIVGNLKKIKKAVPKIEKKTKIHFSFINGGVVIKGSEYEEYIVEKIVYAVDFGFDVEDAFLLLNPDFVLEFLDIKSLTRRTNTKDVRARVIGTKGKVLNTIENLTGAVLVVQGNSVGVIVDSAHLDAVIQAIESLVRGAKHGNVFAYLEKQNVKRKFIDREDLGLTYRARELGVKEGLVEDFEDDLRELDLED